MPGAVEEATPHKSKQKHGSHQMREDGEDADGPRYFGAELHLSDAGHARRGAVKKKPRKQLEPMRAASSA